MAASSVTTANLIQGPGTLYSGNYGATEPTDTAANTTPATSAWTDCGGTQGGAKFTLTQTFSELEVDQIVEVPARRLTKREYKIETSLAEPTLENLVITTNNTSVPASGAGYKSLDLDAADSATQLTYRAFILDGYAPGSFRRRLILRKGLSTSNPELEFKKDGQTLIPATFEGHFVSSSIKSLHIVDQTS